MHLMFCAITVSATGLFDAEDALDEATNMAVPASSLLADSDGDDVDDGLVSSAPGGSVPWVSLGGSRISRGLFSESESASTRPSLFAASSSSSAPQAHAYTTLPVVAPVNTYDVMPAPGGAAVMPAGYLYSDATHLGHSSFLPHVGTPNLSGVGTKADSGVGKSLLDDVDEILPQDVLVGCRFVVMLEVAIVHSII
jgi:hypothetical protein